MGKKKSKKRKSSRIQQRSSSPQPLPGSGTSNDLETALRHHQAGRASEAETMYRRVIRSDSRNADALHLLGVLLMQQAQYDEAVSLIKKAIDCNPSAAAYHNNLGNALKSTGNYDEAIRCYKKALALKPAYPQALYNLGNALKELGHLEEAADSYLKALSIMPDFAEVHNNLGLIYQECDQMEEALSSFKKAYSLNPGSVDTCSNLAEVYEKKNNVEQAEMFSKKALSMDPANPHARYVQARLLRRRGKLGEAVELLAPAVQVDSSFLSFIHFELGKLYDLLHDSSRAYHHFSLGNNLTRMKTEGSDRAMESYLSKLAQMENTVTEEWVQSFSAQSVSQSSDSPCFLVGFPRSGTTLLDQILDCHPQLQVMEEVPVLETIASDIEASYGGYPRALACLDQETIEVFRARYFNEVGRSIVRKPEMVLVDKLPLNIQHVPLAVRLFPATKFILVIRHPCDVVLSNFMQNYKINEAMANFFTLQESARLYKRIMGLWNIYREMLSVNYHTVTYESLVENIRLEVEGLLEFLELDWNEAVLNYRDHARKRTIKTPSYQSVTKPIYKQAKFRWLRYAEHLEHVRADLAPFIAQFGYTTGSG